MPLRAPWTGTAFESIQPAVPVRAGVAWARRILMHAIGHTIKKRNPAMRLSYVSAEKFTIEVIIRCGLTA